MDIKTRIASMAERVDALTLRERALLFGAIVIVTYTVLVVGFLRPLEHREHTIAQGLATANTATAHINAKLDRLLAPKTQAREIRQFKKLSAEVAAMKAQLAGLAAGLVAPRDMPALMRRVLAEVPGVTLTALIDHPTVAVRRTPKSRPFLYRHEMTVIVQGRYAALTHYVTVLAHTRRRVLWGRVSLTADRYPNATLKLHIYTLSARRALLR